MECIQIVDIFGIFSQFFVICFYNFHFDLDGETIRGCTEELDEEVIKKCDGQTCMTCSGLNATPGCNNNVRYIFIIFGDFRNCQKSFFFWQILIILKLFSDKMNNTYILNLLSK